MTMKYPACPLLQRSLASKLRALDRLPHGADVQYLALRRDGRDTAVNVKVLP